MQGISLVEQMGIKKIMVLEDSELVVNQVQGLSVTKNFHMRSYRHKSWDIIESFEAFNIQIVPIEKNAGANRMETIRS